MNTKRILSFLAVMALVLTSSLTALASSHREAPLISNDPLADNTDLYVFRSPGPTLDDQNTITIIANYIPFELPEGGPNYFNFGENIHYEIHIRNQAAKTGPGNGDDITYRFTFTNTNQDPTTFFNIRLGQQNLKTTYICEKSVDGGASWTTVVTNGVVPPTNIGPRSIDAGVGLGKKYEDIWNGAITTGSTGETVFCGPVDDPFFVDLAGIFDLGNFRKDSTIDALRGFNCHAICMKIPISMLQKDHHAVALAKNILDGDFVIGVWASASRPQITTLSTDGNKPGVSGPFVQVSRLGMPLTNEAIIPIGMKDKWNASSPYNDLASASNFTNPELALYVGNGAYGDAVGTLLDLRLDTNSLGGGVPGKGFDFRNTKDGLYPLHGSAAVAGTALDDAAFGTILLQKGAPRSVDILPIFYTGVPNLIPYQLATGKPSGPLSAGKPFINNFLPTLGDMLRLNMAVPVTARDNQFFSSEGLIQAAAIGLTVAPYNTSATLENIPNMDGFPNGRRLEDDVTRIEMQAVGGLVLNAIGVTTDDGNSLAPGSQLLKKLTWNAGVQKNDVAFRTQWPYLAYPHRGSDGLRSGTTTAGVHQVNGINIRAPRNFFSSSNYPNPVATGGTTMNYHLSDGGEISIVLFDMNGRQVATLANSYQSSGDYSVNWKPEANIAAGTYIATLMVDGQHSNDMKITLTK